MRGDFSVQQKKGKDRARPWLTNGPWFLLLAFTLAGLYWIVNRDPSGIALKYGELKQILQDPTVSFQKVQIGRSEIRGEIVTRDPTSDGKDNAAQARSVPFRTPRIGLELDHDLQRLLDRHVGSNYQGEEEVTAMQTISSLVFSFVLLLAIGLGAFLFIRWLAGGGSPLTF